MAGSGDDRPRNEVDCAEWLNHLAFADVLLSAGKTATEVKTMFADMVRAYRK